MSRNKDEKRSEGAVASLYQYPLTLFLMKPAKKQCYSAKGEFSDRKPQNSPATVLSDFCVWVSDAGSAVVLDFLALQFLSLLSVFLLFSLVQHSLLLAE